MPTNYDSQNINTSRIRSLPALIFSLLLWFVVAVLYIGRTPATVRTHDFQGHIDYVRLIQIQHRLPHPSEGWEGWQPPLYYLLMSPLSPGNQAKHIVLVRLVSVLLGMGFLTAVWWWLKEMRLSAEWQAALITFLATTPKFLIHFTTYNNDSMVAALSAWLLICFLSLRRKFRWPLAVVVVLLVTAALYTKLTVVILLATLALLTLSDLFTPSRRPTALKLIALGLVAGLLYAPWLLLHNLPLSGKLFPDNFGLLGDAIKLQLPTWKIFLPPGFIHGQWTTPFVYTGPIVGFIAKGHNYWSMLLATAAHGEFSWPQPSVFWFWLDILTLLGVWSLAAWGTVANHFSRLLGAVTFGAVFILGLYPIAHPYIPNMDWRFIAWVWLPVTMLAGYGVKRLVNRNLAWLPGAILGLGIIIHLVIAASA